MTFTNYGKAFPSLDGMVRSNPWHDQLQFLPKHWQSENIGFFKTFRNTIYYKIILITAEIRWSQI